MKLRTVELFCDMAEITFRDERDSSLKLDIYFEDNEKFMYLWSELEQHIKLMIAEKLGLEEPVHKITYSKAWGEPDTTEDLADISQFEDYVAAALGLESNRDNS